MLLDIVILPSAGLRQKLAKRIKREMIGYPIVFVVDNLKLIPHLSLWHIKTSENRINEMTQELRKIVKNQKPIKISSPGCIASRKEIGIVEFMVIDNKSLISLQQRVFKRIYPFKAGMMPFGLWIKKESEQAKKYGRPLDFKPHFTMGLLKNGRDALRVVKAMEKEKFNFFAKEIYLCKINR